jgi:hypothetical protein
MHRRAMRRHCLALLAALLLAAGPGWPQQPASDEEVQPRIIWGILIQIVISRLASASWDYFSAWLAKSVPDLAGRSGPPNLAADSGAEIRARSSLAVTARTSSNSVVGNPDTAMNVEGGRENYQGMHLALVVPEGKEFAFRPISAGFKTGERFKLRLVSTFDGELTIENINPKGERRHIYPPRDDQVVAVQRGRETFLPLGKDEYFQFTKATGREQLVLQLVDPRAVGDRASKHPVYRQDVKYGSNFLQQVAPNTYPRIAQAVELQHAAH